MITFSPTQTLVYLLYSTVNFEQICTLLTNVNSCEISIPRLIEDMFWCKKIENWSMDIILRPTTLNEVYKLSPSLNIGIVIVYGNWKDYLRKMSQRHQWRALSRIHRQIPWHKLVIPIETIVYIECALVSLEPIHKLRSKENEQCIISAEIEAAIMVDTIWWPLEIVKIYCTCLCRILCTNFKSLAT